VERFSLENSVDLELAFELKRRPPSSSSFNLAVDAVESRIPR
jgi:hypothetical protein